MNEKTAEELIAAAQDYVKLATANLYLEHRTADLVSKLPPDMAEEILSDRGPTEPGGDDGPGVLPAYLMV